MSSGPVSDDPTSDDDVTRFWEDLYTQRDQVWSGNVNAALAARVVDLPAGRALDLGCGEGADALWLAEQGWAVTAVDISATALARARAEGERRGLAVDWRRQDLSEPLPGGGFELVSAMFLQSPVTLHRVVVLRRAAAQVAAGGILLVVGHASAPSWSPHRPDPVLMPSAATVLADLALDDGWEAVEVQDVGRTVTGPAGEAAEILDSVVVVRRR